MRPRRKEQGTGFMARTNRLNKVADWPSLAKSARYEVKTVAIRLGFSSRWLERYFKRKFQQSPLKLFNIWMSQDTGEKAATGLVGKEMIQATGYIHLSSLTRAMVKSAGHGLRGAKTAPGKLSSQLAKTEGLTPDEETGETTPCS